MGAKDILFIVLTVFLISGCYISDKTKPIVTDISKGAANQKAEQKPAVAVTEKPEAQINNTTTVKETGTSSGQAKTPTPQAANAENIHTVIIQDLKFIPQLITIKKRRYCCMDS